MIMMYVLCHMSTYEDLVKVCKYIYKKLKVRTAPLSPSQTTLHTIAHCCCFPKLGVVYSTQNFTWVWDLSLVCRTEEDLLE